MCFNNNNNENSHFIITLKDNFFVSLTNYVSHLNEFVDIPGSRFAIVDTFHRGIGNVRRISSAKHSWYSGLHCGVVHFWVTVLVDFDRF